MGLTPGEEGENLWRKNKKKKYRKRGGPHFFIFIIFFFFSLSFPIALVFPTYLRINGSEQGFRPGKR
ncbi:hypothetical protein BDV30DRAFT_221772 [Aspergillus minisclerotigenes]|uniref:Uncharacterized protein n=1 Tax=Aspergillus minisclerotigenes TaxID=656917 RepID=A0A5N6IJA0_9EURO|nr:hypothetical protein BDV30DRAFT_221772 [Aspergillus minisclerotigenes]